MARDGFVSVCIPLHNQARFIERCLDSVRADSHPNKEIVIVDDGSTDASADLVDRWIARHPSVPVVFDRRPHLGIPATFNRLVDLARGDFLAWLGSDDVLLDGGLAARLEYLDAHPGKMAVFADARVIDGKDRLLNESVYGGYRRVDARLFLSDRSLRRALTTRWCVPQPVLMVRRGLYERIGRYDESLLFEDYDFYLRMLSQDLLGYVDVAVSGYRLHDANHSRRPATRLPVMRQFFRVARKNRRRFDGIEQIGLMAFAAAVGVKALALAPLAWAGGGRVGR